MTSVAVIGLGAMGSRIARRLLDSGHELVVWNRTLGKAERLAAVGAKTATSPAQASRDVEAVVTMVSDPQALRDVTEGPEGVAAGVGESTTVIQMSTVGPAAVQRLASVLPSAGLLDAPVLSSVDEASSGTLTIFAAGPPALVDRWRPLLSNLGSVVPTGALGTGSAAKLVANTTLFGTLGILGEALSLARSLDLELHAAFDVLAATPLAAQAERRRHAIETGEYPTRFSLALARKDADLILEAAEASGADLRLVAAARSWLAEAEHDRAGEDYSAVLARILRD